MKSYKDQIHLYIENHKAELINTLKELAKIPSVRGDAKENAPFGIDCANVLTHIQKLYDNDGFETDLDTDDGYLLSYYGNGDKTLGLFTHADVVSVGDDWILTSPFEPIEKDGCLIGRGVLDDKSAVVISLYCAKMLKELNIPFKSRLVCFAGASEETGMQDIKNYILKHKAPDFSLVCDSAFPLYRGNKGIMHFIATSQTPLNDITDFYGGKSFNITLGKATAKLKYCNELYNALKSNETERITVSKQNNEIIIVAEGISKHGALPEGSLNAGFILSSFLANCELLSESDRNKMKSVSELLSDYYGKPMRIDCEDEDFGKLTCTNGMISLKDGKVSLSFDTRFGKCTTVTDLRNKVNRFFSADNYDVEFIKTENAHITDEKNPYIQACLDTYKAYTGDSDAKAHINAGGTYAMHLPCAAEIGPTLIWDYPEDMPDGHGGAHQPDECINIEGFIKALALAALMLIECDNIERNDT